MARNLVYPYLQLFHKIFKSSNSSINLASFLLRSATTRFSRALNRVAFDACIPTCSTWNQFIAFSLPSLAFFTAQSNCRNRRTIHVAFVYLKVQGLAEIFCGCEEKENLAKTDIVTSPPRSLGTLAFVCCFWDV